MKSKPDKNTVPENLPPRTRKMLKSLSPAATDLDLGDDTEAWIEAMDQKHK